MFESMKGSNKQVIESVAQHITVAAREFVEDTRTVGLSVGITLSGQTVTTISEKFCVAVADCLRI